MREIIILLGLKFYVIQFKEGRKWMGGKYYKVDPKLLQTCIYWIDYDASSWPDEILEIEEY